MTSDNGTNFVGAVNELKELVGQLDKDKIQGTTAQKGVKWTFNPPGAPHFGGAHEVMVKAAKKAIYAVLSSSDVTDEELITVVTGAESLLNSRPLTYQSANIKDDVPLTPNHFFAWANGWAVCTRERRHYEVQPTEEVAQGPRTDFLSVVQMVEGVLTNAEYSSKID